MTGHQPFPQTSRAKPKVYGGIEAGGTKFVCAVGSGPDSVLDRAVFETRAPEATLADVIAFFQGAAQQHGPLSGLGVGAFGPVNIDPRSPGYGHILDTPKPGWAGTDIVGMLERALGIAVAIDTDVNCALMGEARWGSGMGYSNLIYVTIGTGIGAGIMVNDRIVYGASHPEIGHVFVPKSADDVGFGGNCQFHQDRCIEGLVSGPAIKARYGKSADELSEDHAAWDLVANYIAVLCGNLLLTVAPDRIILGGGVMNQKHLYPMVTAALGKNIAGYVDIGRNRDPRHDFITSPGLGADSGICGALALAASSDRQASRLNSTGSDVRSAGGTFSASP
ncbi:MAG: fructokinase [Alphaproteobacteria bacterium]|nr:MAG: fructokinase [Alphaproteobacteria bacterium]PZO41579.1 MAG: fructokinase [Alphaproteobacteria bacterium]